MPKVRVHPTRSKPTFKWSGKLKYKLGKRPSFDFETLNFWVYVRFFPENWGNVNAGVDLDKWRRIIFSSMYISPMDEEPPEWDELEMSQYGVELHAELFGFAIALRITPICIKRYFKHQRNP